MLETHYRVQAVGLKPLEREAALQEATQQAARYGQPYYVYKLVAVVHPPVPSRPIVQYAAEHLTLEETPQGVMYAPRPSRSAADIRREWYSWAHSVDVTNTINAAKDREFGRLHNEALSREISLTSNFMGKRS